MFFNVDPGLQRPLTLFVTIMLAIYVFRPRIMFDEHTLRLRPFGVGYNRDAQKRTLFSLSSMIVPIACLCWVLGRYARS